MTDQALITLSDSGSAYIDSLINEIFKKGMPASAPELIRQYGTKLSAGLAEGYGGSLADFDYQSPDYNTLTALQNNVWQFSSAKSYTQMRDMSKALVGPDGKIRSFDEFKIAARDIVDTQLNWLRTEYDTAIAGGQMAAKWVEIQAQKDTFPLLEFDAVIDNHSSNICPPLNKVILPVDDPFWKVYYPPNHFNCRSTVRQLRKGEVTPKDDIQYPEKISKMFSGNVGINGMIYNKESAYYIDNPAYVNANATLYMPPEEQYIIDYIAEDGTEVKINRKTALEAREDLPDLLKAAETLANNGSPVDLLPAIHSNEKELRTELLPGIANNKNPDLVVDGNYSELKTPNGKVDYDKIQNKIRDAAQQADYVVIKLDELGDLNVLKQIATNRFKNLINLKSITFVTGDGEFKQYLNDEGQ